MKRFQMFAVATLLCTTTLTSRAELTNKTTAIQDTKRDTKEAVSNATAYSKQQLKELDKKAESQFHELGKKLDDLKAKAQSQTGEARTELDKKIAQAEKKLNDLKPKLRELKTATTNAWGEVKSAFDKGIDDLKQILP